MQAMEDRAFPAGFGSVRWVIGSNLRLHGARAVYRTDCTRSQCKLQPLAARGRLVIRCATIFRTDRPPGVRESPEWPAPRPGRARIKDEQHTVPRDRPNLTFPRIFPTFHFVSFSFFFLLSLSSSSVSLFSFSFCV